MTIADTVLDVQQVSKKFRRGEQYNSLRDLVPALTDRLVGRQRHPERSQRDFWALQDVSFSVGRGEAFGIIGGNGAGKSTILKLLTGIMRPTKGAIQVIGRVSALIEVSAGFHQDLTGRENIYLNGAILGMTREEIHRQFDAIVEFSGLEEFIDTPVKRYSSGMFARLGFSVAAHVEPEVLLVDEVLSVGDYLFQKKCLDRMRAVIRSGTTIVFVSHNLREVSNLCNRSLLLEHGRVQMIGPTDDVIGAYYRRGQEKRGATDTTFDGNVQIVSVTVHDGQNLRVEFESGTKLNVTVEVYARRPTDDCSVEIRIVDHNQYPLFDTGTQRLMGQAISLKSDQTFTCTFELDLCLAQGTFHVNAYVHRYVTSYDYDRWEGASTFFVIGAPEARGVVTLHPKLTKCCVGEISAGSILDHAHAGDITCD